MHYLPESTIVVVAGQVTEKKVLEEATNKKDYSISKLEKIPENEILTLNPSNSNCSFDMNLKGNFNNTPHKITKHNS